MGAVLTNLDVLVRTLYNVVGELRASQDDLEK